MRLIVLFDLILFSKNLTSINFILFIIFLQFWILFERFKLLFFLKGFFLVIAQIIFFTLNLFMVSFEIASISQGRLVFEFGGDQVEVDSAGIYTMLFTAVNNDYLTMLPYDSAILSITNISIKEVLNIARLLKLQKWDKVDEILTEMPNVQAQQNDNKNLKIMLRYIKNFQKSF